MMRSLFSGVSGLKTHQTKMDVIGNNISNVNTVAFKSSSTTFSDIMYQTTSQASGATETRGGTNAKQIGLGVTNGATKVSITSSGAAQSTGDALDIRLTDTNSTNFFIVSNGSENLFTRAGSFYIDGNGNLAMTTTGYLVMGWQVDEETGEIAKDTVSALRVMQASNLTSPPEATTNATFSGVLDQNDSNITSSTGYIKSLTFYDSLGYSYTAKFSIKVADATKGEYTISLTNVYDSKNNDILADYVEDGGSVEDIFGSEITTTETYDLSSSLGTATIGGVDYATYTTEDASGASVTYAIYSAADGSLVAQTTDGTTLSGEVITIGTDTTPSITDICAIPSDTTISSVGNVVTDASGNITGVEISTTTIGSGVYFDTSTGELLAVGTDDDKSLGTTKLVMNSSLLGPNVDESLDPDAAIADITIDFSEMLNYDNGGTSTANLERGDTDGTTGAGKKLGTMTGLSISNNGKIYGSYDNGNTALLGQIAVAQFANASGLEELGDNCYQTTLNSGEFDGIGVDISADGSSMATGQLEMSNVDLSSEFTEMIITQRGFQANSRIITVSDTLLEELINLKR